jgi:hypothetical protein
LSQKAPTYFLTFPDKLINRSDLHKAALDVISQTPGSLRFGVDTVGKETSSWAQNILAQRSSRRYSKFLRDATKIYPSYLSHLVGLTGLPKEPNLAVKLHKLPIKLFHTNPELGGAISQWFHELLTERKIIFPDVEVVEGGLGAVNSALDRLRRGEISGKRLAVRLS